MTRKLAALLALALSACSGSCGVIPVGFMGATGGLQSATISLTQTINSAVGVPLTGSIPFYIPPDVSSANLCLANFDQFNGTTAGDITNAKIGVGPSHADNTYTGSPSFKQTGVTIPGNGTYYCTGNWAVPRGGDALTVIAVAWASGMDVAGSIYPGLNWGARSQSAWEVDPLPGGMTANLSLFPAMYVKYKTTAKRVVVEGDSISVAYNSSFVTDSAWYRLGPDYGYAVDARGKPAASLAEWRSGHPHLKDTQTYAGATCDVEVGINDIGTGTTGSGLKTLVLAEAADLKAAGCTKVIIQTLSYCAAYSAQNSERLAYNTLVRANAGSGGWANVDDYYDVDNTLSPSGTWVPAYDSGDQCHPGPSGHAALVPVIKAKLP